MKNSAYKIEKKESGKFKVWRCDSQYLDLSQEAEQYLKNKMWIESDAKRGTYVIKNKFMVQWIDIDEDIHHRFKSVKKTYIFYVYTHPCYFTSRGDPINEYKILGEKEIHDIDLTPANLERIFTDLLNESK